MPAPDRLGRAVIASVAAAMLLSVAGCEKSFTLKHYPDFDVAALKAVAVAPPASDSGDPHAALRFAQQLAEALRANGTYAVIGPEQVAEACGPQRVSYAESQDAAQMREAFADLRGADAVLVGSLAGGVVSRVHRTRILYDEPMMGVGYGYGYGGWADWYGPGYRWGMWNDVPVYERTAEVLLVGASVRASMALVRVADGQVLAATPAPLTAQVYTDRSDADRKQLVAEAEQKLIAQLLEEFAVVPQEVRIETHKALRVARGPSEDPWKNTGKLPADATDALLVLALPPAAAGNTFRLTVTRKGDEPPLLSKDVVYPRGVDAHAVPFDPAALAARAGPGKYEAVLSYGDQRIAKRGFEIK